LETSLSSTDGAEKKNIIEVSVSILPQAEFVEKIGGDKVHVTVMIPPGASPATYEPTPSQLVNLSLAKVYIKIGYVPFEMAWMDRLKATNKDMIVVDSSKGIEIIGDDPHIWLSPMLVKKQAKSIYEALSEINPENEAYYQKNLAVFLGELDKVDEKIKVSLSGFGGKKFMVFHPAWGYFAREYGLEQIPIEVEGKEPSADDIVKLVKIAKQEGIKVIFASPQLSDKSAEVIAKEIGGKVVLIDPLAEDYINNMNKICQEIGKGLV
ncbi:MAG: zinc ABC transporter substrate-binding protein, partial [Eubacteriales bacterium]